MLRCTTASLQVGGSPETVELQHCIKNISIWVKHVAQQLTNHTIPFRLCLLVVLSEVGNRYFENSVATAIAIMLLEKQQWMSVIA